MLMIYWNCQEIHKHPIGHNNLGDSPVCCWQVRAEVSFSQIDQLYERYTALTLTSDLTEGGGGREKNNTSPLELKEKNCV